MTEAAPAEQAVVAEKKKRLFHRIPTSLLVTVIGISLTAWLLPAFTRQWDDRQKARELQAALVKDMASATARALSEAERADAVTRRTQRATLSPAAATEWSVASVAIEATLRAYFGGQMAFRWAYFSRYIDRTIDQAFGGDGSYFPVMSADGVTPDNPNVYRDVLLDSDLGSYDARRDSDSADELNGIGLELLADEEQIAGMVLGAHPTGYSTTTGDLIQELFPIP